MSSLLQRIAKDISETFSGQALTEEERYVAQSTQTSDVERRIRELEWTQPSRSI
ncbi:MAG: hypothetical protein ABSF50_15320 [Burkholderiaceae bacterium]|jgi:hypothetical protein